MKSITINVFAILSIALFSGCCALSGGMTRTDFDFYEAQALTNAQNADGTVFIKSWGMDRKWKKAKQQARKNAIRAILFRGVPNSSVKRPLINEPGAEQKYADYFKRFFAKDGKYNQFITNTSSFDAKDRIKSGCYYRVGVKSKVYYKQLQTELVNAGIAKKFGI